MNYLYAAAAAIALLIGTFFTGLHFGKLSPELKCEAAQVRQSAAEIHQEAKQLQANQAAEKTHDEEVEHPAPLVLHDPVWLREPTLCPTVPVPAAPASEHSASGATDAGSAIDLRAQLQAFAVKYENALSDCRRLKAEWPQ